MTIEMKSEHVLRWVIFAAWLLLPWFFLPLAWVPVISAKAFVVALVAGVGTGALAIASVYRGSITVPKSSLLFASAIVPLSYFVSALGSGGSWDSFVGSGAGQDTVVSVTLWYALLLCPVAALLQSGNEKQLLVMLTMFFIGGSLLTVIQIVRVAAPSVDFGGLANATSSAVGSWHDLAIFFGLFCFVSLALSDVASLEVKIPRTALRILAFLSFTFLFIINQWDVWAVLAGIAGIFLIYLFRSRALLGRRHVLRSSHWVALGAIAVVMAIAGGYIHDRLPASLQIVQTEVRPSWEGTFAVGERVFTGGGFVFGSGPNTFSEVWGAYKPLTVNATQFWSTDFYAGVGFIPTSIITLGILGVIAWSAVLLSLIWNAGSLLRSQQNSNGIRIHSILLLAALYLAALHVLYVPGLAISALTFLVFGASIAASVIAGKTQTWNISLSWNTGRSAMAATCIVIAALLVILCALQYFRATLSDAFVNRAVTSYTVSKDTASASRSINIALAVFPQNARANRAAVEIGLLQLAQLSAQVGASPNARTALQDILAKTIDRGLAAVSVGSGNYLNWLALARLYGELSGVGVEGAEAQARTAYERARTINPTNPLPLIGLAQLDLAKGDTKSARKHLEVASAMKPDLGITHFLLVQTSALENNLAAAQKEAVAVVRLTPQDPLGWYTLGLILYARGSYSEAVAALANAISLQSAYANAYFILGLAYFELGQTDEAIAAFERAGSLDPSNSFPQSVIENIRAGRTPLTPAATSTGDSNI